MQLATKHRVTLVAFASVCCATVWVRGLTIVVANFQNLHFPQVHKMGNAGSAARTGTVSSGWRPAAPGTAPRRSKAGYDITPLTLEQRNSLAANLNDFQRYVTLEAGTERAFTGKTVNGYSHDNKAKGTYVSAIGKPITQRVLAGIRHTFTSRWVAAVQV